MYKNQNNLINKLKKYNTKENIFKAIQGVLFSFELFLIYILTITLAESIFNFSSIIRTVIFFLAVLFGLLFFSYQVVLPLLQTSNFLTNFDLETVANKIGVQFSTIKDEMLNALQLIKEKNNAYSQEMVDAAFENVYKKTLQIDFEEAISNKYILKHFKISSFLLLITVGSFILISPLQGSLKRILNFSKDFTPPAKFTILVVPGNAEIMKGDSLRFNVKVDGEIPSEINFYSKNIHQTEYEQNSFVVNNLGELSFSKYNIDLSFNYYFQAENISTSIFNVKVVSAPIVSKLNLEIFSPKYAKLSKIVQNDNGNISALKGSRAKLELTASKELEAAKIIFASGKSIALSVSENKAVGEFNINKNDAYKIVLTDSEHRNNVAPIDYSIECLFDKVPTIKLLSPDTELEIIGNETIAPIMSISDDYGFSKLILNYRLSKSNFEEVTEQYKQIEIPIRKNVKEDEVYYNWNLEPLFLAVEDEITYYFEIFDNDFVSGPKSAKSELHILKVPSVDEIFAKSDETNSKSQTELEESFEEAKKLSDELKKINDELKKDDKEISWDEKKSIESAMQKFDELQQKVEDIKEQIKEMQKNLDKNELLSEETLKKYEELQDLFDDMSSEELKEAMSKMQQQLQKMDRNDVQNSMQNMKLNEEAFQKSIERTMNLLKKIQIEQKADEITKRIEKLNEDLEKLNTDTEKSDLSDKKENSKLQQRQDKTKEDAKKISEQMKNLKDKMSEFENMPNEKIEDLMKEMDSQKNEQLSEQAKEQLQKMNKMMAQKNQSQMQQNMSKNLDSMQQMMNEMKMQNQMKVMSQMMQITSEILSLSKQQEKLKENTKSLSPNDKKIKENARKQNEIQQNLQRLMQKMNNLSQETFAITPEMGRELGNAMRSMQQSQNALSERQTHLSSTKQQGSMQSLNGAAKLMKGAMQSMMNSSGQGGGMMSLMQQLQQMSQQQMGLNQMTQMMKGGMTPQQQQQLQRLAEQQRLIQKSLQQLNEEAKESGQSKKLAANLENILEEMNEVITGMESEKIDDNLIQSQEKILSKMLDAQRSINERDFEKRRESEGGKEFKRISPSELVLSPEKKKELLRDELIRASKEGYSKDYQELIKQYFEILESQESK